MSKTSEALKALNCYNTHDLLQRFADKGKDVACVYYPPVARSVQGSSTRVYSPSHATDPKAAWYNNKQKSFVGQLPESMPKAVAWATEKYNITEWAACPTDRATRVPKVVRDRALAAVKEASKANG